MSVKAYKGFNKDMTCRGFRFKEGETYHENEAKLCEKGFHACKDPLGCFGYYDPAHSVYHEVELDGVTDEARSDDSKICGKTIKVGKALDIAGICKAHFEYTKSKCDKEIKAEGNKPISGGDGSSLSGGDGSSLSGGFRSSLSGGDGSSLSGSDGSSLSGGNRSSLSGGNRSSLSGGNRSSLSGGNESSLSGSDGSSLSGGFRSYLSGGNESSLSGAGGSSLSGGDGSSLSGGDGSSLSGGNGSSLAAFNSKAKAGMNSLIALANKKWDDDKGEYVITDFAAAIVDGKKIKPDTWYKLKNGKFVEVTENEDEV